MSHFAHSYSPPTVQALGVCIGRSHVINRGGGNITPSPPLPSLLIQGQEFLGPNGSIRADKQMGGSLSFFCSNEEPDPDPEGSMRELTAGWWSACNPLVPLRRRPVGPEAIIGAVRDAATAGDWGAAQALLPNPTAHTLPAFPHP